MPNIIKRIKSYLLLLKYRRLVKLQTLIKEQRVNPLSIPVIIINFNQLFYLRQLVNFLIKRNFSNILIVDNNSDFQPLLEYYEEMKDIITVEYMDQNYGHMVFFTQKWLQEKYGRGYFFLTDADIVPNPELPENFARKMLEYLDQYFMRITKVGFALKISDIPEFYPPKRKVLKWEKQFWKMEVEPNVYKASTDTTFALYKPQYPKNFNDVKFLRSIRLAGKFTAKHGGWYVDPNKYSEENLHYIKSVSMSSTWKLDAKGAHDNRGKSDYNK